MTDDRRYMVSMPNAERPHIEAAAREAGLKISLVESTRSKRAGKFLIYTDDLGRDHTPFWRAWRKARGEL